MKRISIGLRLFLVYCLLFGTFTIINCENNNSKKKDAANTRQDETVVVDSKNASFFSYEVINIYPHERSSFTQGLSFKDGFLYEGTGLNGKSSLCKVELETGNILQIHRLSAKLFGEGIAILGDKIIQLTWMSNEGFVYNRKDFKLLREFTYPTEGWGITYDGESLIVSDGTSTLHFLNPETFEEIRQIEVFDNNGPVSKLNELEYVKGKIFANVWQTDFIAIISPGTGRVDGWVNLQGLLTAKDRSIAVDVLNGIAYDSRNDRLFVTGKLWPKLFEIELIPQ